MRQLELLGVDADTVNDGIEAIEAWAAAKGHYAAVLADIHMPRMDGHELARQIRAAEAKREPAAARTPIVAVTANAMKGEDERCLAAGMDAYLAKPVNMDQLRTTLERWMPIEDATRETAARRRRAEASLRDRSRRARRLARRRRRGDQLAAGEIPRHRDRGRARDRGRIARRRPAVAGGSRAQAQGRGPDRWRRSASARRRPRSNRPARPATAPAAARGSVRWPPSCAARSPRSNRERDEALNA